MAIETYEQLQSSIGGWLHRTDLSARADDFIALAEVRFNRNLRVRQMETEHSEVVADPVMDLPDDWLEMVDRVKIEGEPLELVSRSQFETRQHAGQTGCYYAIWGNTLRIGQPLREPATLTFDYYARIPSLSDDNADNWLLRDGPDVYLYGSLLEAAPYLNDDARAETWRALLQVGLNDLQAAADRAKFAGGTLAQDLPR